MKVNVINLTPHDINLVNEVGEIIRTFPGTDSPARCATYREKIMDLHIEGVEVPTPLYSTTFGEVENLPAPIEGVRYIVSNTVAQAFKGKRYDLIIPDAIVRNKAGNIIGCKAFATV
jgi:hypothetical protein